MFFELRLYISKQFITKVPGMWQVRKKQSTLNLFILFLTYYQITPIVYYKHYSIAIWGRLII